MSKSKSKRKFKVIVLFVFAILLLTFQFGTVIADNSTSSSYALYSNDTLEGTQFLAWDKVNIEGTINGTAFIAGYDVDISGVINGDLFVAGEKVTISGTVNGSVISAAENLSIAGTVSNNIYSAGSNVTLKSQNKGTAFLVGEKITIDEQANIEKDLFAGGTQIFNHATVGGSFFGASDNTSISGSIGKDVKVKATDLYIESGEIEGNLSYNSKNEATISKDSTILGYTDWYKPEPQPKPTRFPLSIVVNMLLSVIGLLITWFVITLIRPRFWATLGGNIKNNIPKSLGLGALAIIVTPTAMFFLMISVVGIPFSIILACLYGITFYISKIIVASYIGLLFKESFKWSDKHKGIWISLLGLVILSVLGIIPYFGVIIKILTALLGFGSIVIYISNRDNDKCPKVTLDK